MPVLATQGCGNVIAAAVSKLSSKITPALVVTLLAALEGLLATCELTATALLATEPITLELATAAVVDDELMGNELRVCELRLCELRLCELTAGELGASELATTDAATELLWLVCELFWELFCATQPAITATINTGAKTRINQPCLLISARVYYEVFYFCLVLTQLASCLSQAWATNNCFGHEGASQ